jgi:hypothetical protein
MGTCVRAQHNTVRQREALGQIAKALKLLDTLPDTPARDTTELGLRLAQGVPALALRGYAGAEVAQAYGRAKLLSERLDERVNRFAAVRGVWNNALMCGDTGRTLALARELDALAGRVGRRAGAGGGRARSRLELVHPRPPDRGAGAS